MSASRVVLSRAAEEDCLPNSSGNIILQLWIFAMHIIAEGRLLGFDAGDWSLLFAGAAISALLVFFV
jgi:hypothetical protein